MNKAFSCKLKLFDTELTFEATIDFRYIKRCMFIEIKRFRRDGVVQ